jgi:CMP/dCMP kinase
MGFANIIAIDGPAGSGKSTLGEKLAKRLDYLYFDTGVMYRAVTLAALEREIPVDDEEAVTSLTHHVQIDVRPPSQPDGRAYDVILDGQDVTWAIRHSDVEANVSQVSAYPGVRQALATAQRRIGLRGQVVMVGRDIGTVVLPEADLKIYLDASVEERARRRCQEMRARGIPAQEQAVLEAMLARDEIDSTRQMSPLRAATDAVIMDSDHLDAEQVFERVMDLADNN